MTRARYAIPVYSKNGATTHIGTGFLGERRGELGLLTAARVPLGRQPFATSDWVGWPTTLFASVVPGVTDEPIQLLVGDSGARRPSFSYVLSNPASGYLVDMIGVFGTADVPALERLAESFEVVHLESEASSPEPGTDLTVRGFPDRGGSTTWPYESSRKATGPLERITEDGLLEARITLADGFCGAPVFAASGFVGMVSQNRDGACRILPTDVLVTLGA